MFHKPFRIKSNSATKNSERKRLKRDISSNFPDLTQHHVDTLIPNKSAVATVKVVTHDGTNVTVTTVDKEPIMFESGGVLCPTVYTLWRYPSMLQSVTTWPAVVPKLQGGADLMLPGVVTGDQGGCGLEGIVKNQLCGVNTVKNRSVIGVGVALMSHDQMVAYGMRGKGFEILHLYEDKLWEMGSKLDPPLVPMELPLPTETTPTEQQTTPTTEQVMATESTNEEPVKVKPVSQSTGPLKPSMMVGGIQKVGGVRMKKGKKRKPYKSSEEATDTKTEDKTVKSKLKSKFSSRTHKRFEDHSINEIAKTDIEITREQSGDEGADESAVRAGDAGGDDEELSSICSEDEYLLSTVEDQSVAIGLMPDNNSDLMQIAEKYSPELVVMLKRTITLYVPIGDRPTNLPKKLNKRFVTSQKESLKDHGLVRQDESNVNTLQMHAQEVMKCDFEPARGLSSEVVEVLGERKKMIVYVPIFYKEGEPRPETDIANFSIDDEEISSNLTNDFGRIFNAIEEPPSPPPEEKSSLYDPSLPITEVATNALKLAERAKKNASSKPSAVPKPPPSTEPPPPPAPEDLIPLNSKDPRFLERYCTYRPRSEGYRQAGLLATKLTILDYVTGEFELQPFQLQRLLRKKYGINKRLGNPEEPDTSAITVKDLQKLPTITPEEFQERCKRDNVTVTDIPCVLVNGEALPISQVLSDTDYTVEVKGDYTPAEKLVLRALKKVAVFGLLNEDEYTTELDDVEPIDLISEKVSKLYRERVKSGHTALVFTDEPSSEPNQRSTREGNRPSDAPTPTTSLNYDRALVKIFTEPVNNTTSTSKEVMLSTGHVTTPQITLLSITETVKTIPKLRSLPKSVQSTPETMTSPVKCMILPHENASNLQKKAAMWATMEDDGAGDTPDLLQNMLLDGITEGKHTTNDNSTSPPKDETASEANTFPPKDETMSEAHTSPPKDETASDGNTSPPKDETASEATTFPPKDETMSEAHTSPPKDETASDGNTSPPKDETASEVNRSPPKDETASEPNTSPPKDETASEPNTSPPKDETASEPKKKPKKKKKKPKRTALESCLDIQHEIAKTAPGEPRETEPSDIPGERPHPHITKEVPGEFADLTKLTWYHMPELAESLVESRKNPRVNTASGAAAEEMYSDEILRARLHAKMEKPLDFPTVKSDLAEDKDLSLFLSAPPDVGGPDEQEEESMKIAELDEVEDDSSSVDSEPNPNWYPIPQITYGAGANLIAVEPPMPTMDELLRECFYHAIRLKVTKEDLPLLTSTFYGTHMMSTCPDDLNLDIKKSSYKKLSKFLQKKQAEGILRVEETAKGVESITFIDFKHPKVKKFTPYFVLLFEAGPTDMPASRPGASRSTASNKAVLHVKELHIPSSNLLPFFRRYGYDKDSVLDEKQVREVVTSYVKENDLVSPDDPREVLLDPYLSGCLAKKEERGLLKLKWQEVTQRTLSKMKPAYSVAHGDHKPIIKRGQLHKVNITLTQRTGNKKVTIIENLSVYEIQPREIADKLQKIVAASTTVSKEPHSTSDCVIVQGNACRATANLLQEDYGLPLKFIEAVNKLKPPKKKKSGRK